MSFKADIDICQSKYWTAYTKVAVGVGSAALARMYYDYGDESKALDYLIDSVNSIASFMSYSLTYSCGGATKFYLMRALKQLPDYTGEPSGLSTMGGLLSLMLSAEPSEILYFIGIVDAYRQSVWNQPFNQEFYAALARGFMQWE